MEQATKTIDEFRQNLDSLCRKVWAGRLELTVTRYSKPCFKVIKLQDNQQGVDLSFTQVRDQTPMLYDLLNSSDYVFLTSWGKRRVACVRL